MADLIRKDLLYSELSYKLIGVFGLVNSYLQITGLQLGILANFTSLGLQFKCILIIRNT